MTLRRAFTIFSLTLVACGGSTVPSPSPPPAASSAPATITAPAAASTAALLEPRARTCGGDPLKVRFFDVGQALAALVELPDGRHILVDTGDSPTHPGCGAVCANAHKSLLSKLEAALGGHPIDLLWITHPHSDHIGGAKDILGKFAVKAYVDNGRDLTVGEIKDVRDAAEAKGVPVTVVEPGHDSIPLAGAENVKITGIAPSKWLPACKTDRNVCSILLRIDYCSSSILFTGDAEVAEEALLDPHGPATLLQVGHHGSVTSSGSPFLDAVQPKYAVVSAGKPDEGENRGYCHPARSTIDHLTTALGGAGNRKLAAFDGASCTKGVPHLSEFVDVPTSDRFWATERDGDIVLTTTGDGTFAKQ